MAIQVSRRLQHCTFCKNHGLNIPKKSHICPKLNCQCHLCNLTKNSQAIMKQQQRIWRHKKKLLKDQDGIHDDKTIEKLLRSSKRQACDKCRNHNILQLKRNHQCLFEDCNCQYCSLTIRRREIMKQQQRIRRSQRQENVQEKKTGTPQGFDNTFDVQEKDSFPATKKPFSNDIQDSDLNYNNRVEKDRRTDNGRRHQMDFDDLDCMTENFSFDSKDFSKSRISEDSSLKTSPPKKREIRAENSFARRPKRFRSPPGLIYIDSPSCSTSQTGLFQRKHPCLSKPSSMEVDYIPEPKHTFESRSFIPTFEDYVRDLRNLSTRDVFQNAELNSCNVPSIFLQELFQETSFSNFYKNMLQTRYLNSLSKSRTLFESEQSFQPQQKFLSHQTCDSSTQRMDLPYLRVAEPFEIACKQAYLDYGLSLLKQNLLANRIGRRESS